MALPGLFYLPFFFIDCSIISYSLVLFFPASSTSTFYVLGVLGVSRTRPSAGIVLVKHSGITTT